MEAVAGESQAFMAGPYAFSEMGRRHCAPASPRFDSRCRPVIAGGGRESAGNGPAADDATSIPVEENSSPAQVTLPHPSDPGVAEQKSASVKKLRKTTKLKPLRDVSYAARGVEAYAGDASATPFWGHIGDLTRHP
jgi:hypothetical protein